VGNSFGTTSQSGITIEFFNQQQSSDLSLLLYRRGSSEINEIIRSCVRRRMMMRLRGGSSIYKL